MHVFGEEWESLRETKVAIRQDRSPNGLAQQIAGLLQTVDGTITSVGIGLAGQMSKDGAHVFNAPNLGWRNVAFVDVLAQITGLPQSKFRVVNDLNAVLYGEWGFGAARGFDDILAVYVGTGVGGGLLMGGNLLAGAGGKAGEIGHAKVVRGGRLCGCGEYGCVEAYAGGIHLEQQVFSVATEYELQGFATSDSVDLRLADDLYEKVPGITKIWEDSSNYLSLVVANAVTLLNPGLLLLGGGVLENLPQFRELILQKITPLVLSAARGDLQIRFGVLGDRAGTLGSCLLADAGKSDSLATIQF